MAVVRIKILWRILILLVVLSILPLGVLSYFVRDGMHTSLGASAREGLTLRIGNAQDQINGFIDGHIKVLRSVAQLPAIAGMDPVQQVAALAAVQKATPTFSSILIVDDKGMNTARSDGGALLSFADRAWFKEVSAGADISGGTVISKVSGKPILSLAIPIRRESALVGVLAASVDLADINKVVNGIKIGATGFAWLVDQENKLMAHPDAKLVEKQEAMTGHAAIQRARKGDLAVDRLAEQGKEWLAVQRSMRYGWVLVVQMADEEAMAPARALDGVLVNMLAGLVLAVLLGSFLLARSLSQPIGVMARFTRALSGGDFTAALAIDRRDELGDMARALREMQKGLGHHIRSVQAAAVGMTETAGLVAGAAQAAAISETAISLAFADTTRDVEATTAKQRSHLRATQDVIAELVTSVDQVASSANHQASQVSHAADVVMQVTSQARDVQAAGGRLARVVTQMHQAAMTGEATVGDALGGIALTWDKVDRAAATVRELGARSEAIGAILGEISAIASQTNMLALNAAIESARAGEAGRGFAVVADEVRKLADRSVRSAQEIHKILAALQEGVNEAVTVMAEGASAANAGAGRTHEVQAALKRITEAVQTCTDEARIISESSGALVQGHEILSAVTQTLAAVTEENAAAAEEMAAGSETVRSVVEDLGALATQNLTAIQGVGGELGRIQAALRAMSDAVERLNGTSASLSSSTAAFKV